MDNSYRYVSNQQSLNIMAECIEIVLILTISFLLLLLIFRYGMIIFEVAHRTIITMIMATASITVLAMLNER